MDVLITGGAGFVGQHLCAELIDRGHDVTSLSRTPNPSVLPDEVKLTEGDVTNFDSIEGAFEGKDVVVNLAALPPLHQPPRETSHDSVCIGGSINAVEAAEEHGVTKFIEMSSLGADPNGDIAYWRTQGLGEEVVRYSDLDWIIFRPSFIFGEGSETFTFIEQYTTPYVTVLPSGGKRPKFQPIVSVPMSLAVTALYAADPIPQIPLGIDQARALEMTNVTDGNDVGAFGFDKSKLTTLSMYLSGEQRNPKQRSAQAKPP